MKTFKAVVVTIIIALLIAFALVNTHYIDIKITAGRVLFSSQLWVVVYVSFIVGVVFGMLLCLRARRPKKTVILTKPSGASTPEK